MSIPQPKVEIGFDLVGANAPFLTLDNPTKGKLNDPAFPLSGTIFFDVTDRLVELSISRGKNRQLDVYDPGLASVSLRNNDRLFDPTYEASPYFGAIIPKRAVRISSNNELAFVGVVDDWNFFYQPNGESITSISASDAFSYFNDQTINGYTPDVELSGTRINEILNLPEVDWPTGQRAIDPGQGFLTDEPITDGQNVLTYFQLISVSEPGSFFMSREGNVVFQDRNNIFRYTDTTLADDGTGIPYIGMRIQYGSELLYNEIVASSAAGTAIVENLESQAQYGILNLTRNGLLVNDLESLKGISALYEARFAQPEYRFEAVEILLDELSREQQDEILSLEISDIINIKFTPNNIPPAIVQNAEIIKIDHSITQTSHVMSLGFASIVANPWTLNDPVFGKLSSGNILYF